MIAMMVLMLVALVAFGPGLHRGSHDVHGSADAHSQPHDGDTTGPNIGRPGNNP